MSPSLVAKNLSDWLLPSLQQPAYPSQHHSGTPLGVGLHALKAKLQSGRKFFAWRR